jgi:uncharacterized protein YecT (DUF1311 family)
MTPLSLVLLLAAAAPHAVSAPAKDSASARISACMDKSDGTNIAWSGCSGAEIKRQDARLNVVWKRVYAKLPKQSKADLLAEQRAWNTYKEASCRLYANGDWGRQGQVFDFGLCRAQVIEARIQDLENIEGMTSQGR